MREKPHISLPIIVEGKYDKNTLSQLVDAHILPTDGFAIFHAKERQAYLRRVCEEHGAILLTDSDGGGTQIRSFLAGILPKEKIHSVYIPKIEGKEKRKAKAGKAGTLGVEGMPPEVLLGLLAPFFDGTVREEKPPVTSLDLYEDGLSGGMGAKEKRAALCRLYGFPDDLTTHALLEALNLFSDKEEYREKVKALGEI
ncbi:MAG TPA: DUF4093 domain-containing protein [Clostridiales bacterium]|nr:DUF4093 domain-containing protein [Clostridiales bacterium]